MNESLLLKELGTRIRVIRLGKDMTQNQLAINCNFEKSSMSKIESGQVNMSYLTLYKICKGLNISMKELFAE